MDLGWTVERVQGWRVPDALMRVNRPVILYGEPLFAEAVADQLGLVLLEPSIDWLTTLPRRYAGRDIELLDLHTARKSTAEAFVKPADGKIFEPKVYATGADLPSEVHVDGEILVLRSEVVEFVLEVRCFVNRENVTTLSPYWREGELATDELGRWPFFGTEKTEALAFANAVLGDPQVELPPACTLDLGRLRDGTWLVVEANPCWGAGLYGCDPREVLEAIRETVLPREAVTPRESVWISKRRHP